MFFRNSDKNIWNMKLRQRGAVQKEKACTVNSRDRGHSWALQLLSHAPSEWELHPAAQDQKELEKFSKM